jgi:hypothetical protein
MAKDAVVRQTPAGIVVDCTAMSECLQQNPGKVGGSCIPGGSDHKTCLLSVDHGGRCLAYPQDTQIWLIDQDTSKIKQIL